MPDVDLSTAASSAAPRPAPRPASRPALRPAPPPELLPGPRRLVRQAGEYRIEGSRLVLLSGPEPRRLRFTAGRLQKALEDCAGVRWEVNASGVLPPHLVGVELRIAPQEAAHAQGYRLSINPDRVVAAAHDEPGLFYAVSTLVQLIEQYGSSLPCLEIDDYPDFPVRGVMLDVSRDKVPTQQTLYELVDLLASWKINQFQLYTEHTYAYQRHPQVWATASPLTAQEIMDLDEYCRQRFIELVPNQNSFGHMHRWLTHPEYEGLGEVKEGFQAPWGYLEGPFSLAPVHPGSLELVSGLYDELLPHFSSRMVNVGCDETFDLGQGLSKAECEARGAGRVYLEFLNHIYTNIKERGFTMQFWGDIIIQHPELIPYLPRDVIALEWGYEADHPFDDHGARFAAAGIPFYVCPGTSTWSSLAGRTDNALANLLSAAEAGLKHGACGYLNTDWGDNGHWQFLPASYLGYAAGAAYSWAVAQNRDLDIQAALSRHAFRDRAGVMGAVAYDLGNVYQALDIDWIHSSALSWILQRPLDVLGAHPKMNQACFDETLAAIDRALLPMTLAQMDRPDAALVVREYSLTARLLKHACRRGLLGTALHNNGGVNLRPMAAELELELRALIEEYESLWLARCRPGGMVDSVARFEKARKDYLNLLPDSPPLGETLPDR